MGLDWMLWVRKPKKGYENTYQILHEKINNIYQQLREKEDPTLREMLKRLIDEINTVSKSCYEALNCPRIGIDEEATRHYLEVTGRTEVNPDDYGKYDLELAKNKDGIADFWGFMASPIDFRGQVLQGLSIIDDELKEEAYQPHTPEQMIEYAKKLQQVVQNTKKNPNFKNDEQLQVEVEILESAIRWLRFWGKRGFGFDPWY